MNKVLPKGWFEDDLITIIGNKSYMKDGDWIESKDQDPNGEIRLIQLADIGEGVFKNKSHRYLTYKKAKELKCTFLNEGDILVARMPEPLGRACIFPKLNQRCITAVDVCIIRISLKTINNKLLCYFINSPIVRGKILIQATGTTRQRISRKKLEKLQIPLPPLTEQKRIAAKLDAILPRVKKLKERLGKVPELIKKFRQSVLDAAVTGKLTEEWSKEKEILKWERKKIGDFLTIITGKTPSKKFSKYYGGNKYPFFKPASLNAGINVETGEEFLTEEGIRQTKKLPINSVLVTGIGATIGKTGLIKKVGASNQQIHAILPSSEIIPKFLYYQIIDTKFQKQIIGNASATTLPIINKTRFLDLELFIPSIEEQKEIVRQVDTLFSVADKLEQRITIISERVEQLGQSVLAKAFRGELVANEAELAEKEGRTFETAEELLERIKVEKKKLEAERKKGRKRK